VAEPQTFVITVEASGEVTPAQPENATEPEPDPNEGDR
jgi:hypothetical protein